MRWLIAIALSLFIAAPARAADVARVPLGQTIHGIVAGPDGGAWVAIHGPGLRGAIGHAGADGSFRSVPTESWPQHGALAPDGRAWFLASDIVRVDAALNIDQLEFSDAGWGLAAGPDGRMWMPTFIDPAIVKFAPDGAVTRTPVRVSGCRQPILMYPVRASDGAMWFAGACGLVRFPLSGAPVLITDKRRVGSLAADGAGGMWFASPFEPAGRIDINGNVVALPPALRDGVDVAVAPDGAGWFVTGRCVLVRAGLDGRVTNVRTPIPTRHIAFDPAGGMWLASRTRLVHNEPASAACDDTPPSFRVTPRVRFNRVNPGLDGSVSLAALRRSRGFRVRVREAVDVSAAVAMLEDGEPFSEVSAVTRGARVLRSAAASSAGARGRRAVPACRGDGRRGQRGGCSSTR